MIFYLVAIMSFVWRTSPLPSSTDNSTLTESSVQILLPRVVISCVLTLGLVYFLCIASTLRRYGTMMDRAWQRKIRNSMMIDINSFSYKPEKKSNNGGGWGADNVEWAGWGATSSGSPGGWGNASGWGQAVPSSSWNAWDPDHFSTNHEGTHLLA